MVRVLVVDDSPLFAEAISQLLTGDPTVVVVGVASDGRQALALTESLRPDVITMDIHMPVMGGLEAIEEIMARWPTPILVLTGDPDLNDLPYEALRRGALDILAKPTDPGAGPCLLERVRLLASVPVVRHPYGHRRRWRALTGLTPRVPGLDGGRAAPLARPGPPPAATARTATATTARTATATTARTATTATTTGGASPVGESAASCAHAGAVVAIAASTGGPAALAQIIEALPAGFPAAVLIVQHIAVGFMPSLTGWLRRVSQLSVQVGVDGARVERGTVIFAPDDQHMILDSNRTLHLDQLPALGGHRPSGNRLLQSVARASGAHAVGVVLSGMGDDGAVGLAAIRAAGGLTIAQDERSSVVFGMPQAAQLSGAAVRVLPLDQIAEALCAHFGIAG